MAFCNPGGQTRISRNLLSEYNDKSEFAYRLLRDIFTYCQYLSGIGCALSKESYFQSEIGASNSAAIIKVLS